MVEHDLPTISAANYHVSSNSNPPFQENIHAMAKVSGTRSALPVKCRQRGCLAYLA